MTPKLIVVLAAACVATSVPSLASAYIGPGAGLSAIGTILALVGAVLLGIVGFVWYPIKRLLAKHRERRQQQERAAKDRDAT